MSNSRNDNYIEKIPKVLKNYIISFFDHQELRKIAMVNKEFNKLSNHTIKELIKKYSDNIFYMIGGGINIANEVESSMKCSFIYRKNIPKKEIYESFAERNHKEIRKFNNKDCVFLFKTKNEALQYSKYLKEEEFCGDQCEQSAVFKVVYIGKLQNLTGYNLRYKNNDEGQNLDVTRFESNQKCVIPLEATLEFEEKYSSQKLKNFGPIDCSNYGLLVDSVKENSSKCSIF